MMRSDDVISANRFGLTALHYRDATNFVFQLTPEEFDSLRSQFVISKGRGGRRYLPYVFTEHGAIMAANVLNSKTAVQASVQVVRAFIRLREMLASKEELARKLSDLEHNLGRSYLKSHTILSQFAISQFAIVEVSALR